MSLGPVLKGVTRPVLKSVFVEPGEVVDIPGRLLRAYRGFGTGVQFGGTENIGRGTGGSMEQGGLIKFVSSGTNGAGAFQTTFVDTNPDLFETGAGLTAAADGKQITVSKWMNPDNDANFRKIFSNLTASVNVNIDDTGKPYLVLRNAAATVLAFYTSSQVIDVDGNDHHVHWAVDLSQATVSDRVRLWVDGTEDNSMTVGTAAVDDDIDLTVADWSIGAGSAGALPYGGSLSELWVAFEHQTDNTKFRNANGTPNDVGTDGSLASPTTTAAIVYSPKGNGDNAGTGGNFGTVTGTPETNFNGPGSPNVRREQTNLSGVFTGVLGEPASTNVALNSEDASAWPAFGGAPVVTTNTDVAPDGKTTADTVSDNDGAGTPGLTVGGGVTIPNDSSSWCVGLFIKKTISAGNFPHFNLRITGGTGVFYGIVFNTDDGTYVTAQFQTTPASVFVQDLNSDYWRVCITGANNSTGNTSLNFALNPAWNSDGNPNQDPSATGPVIVWGGSIANDAIATSYIPTTTAAVLRGADDVSLGITGLLDALTEGTLTFKGRLKDLSIDSILSGFSPVAPGNILTVSQLATNWNINWFASNFGAGTPDLNEHVFILDWNNTGDANLYVDNVLTVTTAVHDFTNAAVTALNLLWRGDGSNGLGLVYDDNIYDHILTPAERALVPSV